MEFVRKFMKGKVLKEYKENLSLSKIQREILIGTLLGDASISLINGKPIYSVKFEQANKEYIDYLYVMFSDFTGMIPRLDVERNSYWFRTYSHSCFKFYYDIFYKRDKNKSVKRIPFNIHRYLTPRAIAHWYMDDGSLNKKNRNCYIATHSFLFFDLKEIRKVLFKYYKLNTTLHKDRDFFKLYFNSETRPHFFSLINPYILPVFKYKLIIDNKINNI